MGEGDGGIVYRKEEHTQNLVSTLSHCRPEWDRSTTAEQLDQLEREEFLKWRRQLATLQENEKLVVTPFEKNLEFWRQLWRVIERRYLCMGSWWSFVGLLGHSQFSAFMSKVGGPGTRRHANDVSPGTDLQST